jgi:hypothetical protein
VRTVPSVNEFEKYDDINSLYNLSQFSGFRRAELEMETLGEDF